MTVWTTWPLTGTEATTGDGGSPPPTNGASRAPPHAVPVAVMPPEALKRFTRYPLAAPSMVAQLPCVWGMGRLVLKATIPAAMIAEVTVCSPWPFWFRFMNQPLAVEVGITPVVLQEVPFVALLGPGSALL